MFLSGLKEAVEGEAVITDVDEETLQEVLHYIYTGKLSGKEFSVNSLSLLRRGQVPAEHPPGSGIVGLILQK